MNILEISVIEHLYVLLNISLFLFHYNSHLSIISFSTVRKNIYSYINCDLS